MVSWTREDDARSHGDHWLCQCFSWLLVAHHLYRVKTRKFRRQDWKGDYLGSIFAFLQSLCCGVFPDVQCHTFDTLIHWIQLPRFDAYPCVKVVIYSLGGRHASGHFGPSGAEWNVPRWSEEALQVRDATPCQLLTCNRAVA